MAQSIDLKLLLEQVATLKNYGFKDNGERFEVALALREVSDHLQSIEKRLQDMLTTATIVAALKLCLDIRLFEKWEEVGAGQKTSTELADMTAVDVRLLDVVLKHLAACEVIQETATDTYACSNLSLQFLDPNVAAAINMFIDLALPAVNALPAFAAASSYDWPSNPRSTPFSLAKNFDGTFYEYLQNNKEVATNFDLSMRSKYIDRESWLTLYPVDERLFEGLEDEGPILVDVGGNVGHVLKEFYDRYPDRTAGRLYLQDQARAIERADLPTGINKMVHDFFTEQPIKGARAYYMRRILHNWSDELSRTILNNLKAAMKAGYSRILINEIVIPAMNAPHTLTSRNIVMLAEFGACDRDEKAWRALINSAGLEVEKTWTDQSRIESVIEVRLP